MVHKFKKEEDSEFSIVWRSLKDPDLTIQAHSTEPSGAFEEEGDFWYVFPAKGGRGIPNTPESVMTKKEAKEVIKKLKKDME